MRTAHDCSARRVHAQPRKSECTSPTTARPPRASSSISTVVPTTVPPSAAIELVRRAQRAAGREHIVDEQHPGAVGDVVVRLDRGGAVLEVVGDGCRGPGQLAGLADRHQPHLRGDRDGAGEQEPARLDPGDDVELAGEGLDHGVDHGAEGPRHPRAAA